MKFKDEFKLLRQIARFKGYRPSAVDYSYYQDLVVGTPPRAQELIDEYGSWPEVLEEAGAIIPTIHVSKEGYEKIIDSKSRDIIPHHRLLATLLVDELEELRDKHVHHKNWCPWDNRLDNIEVLTPGEHTATHNRGEYACE